MSDEQRNISGPETDGAGLAGDGAADAFEAETAEGTAPEGTSGNGAGRPGRYKIYDRIASNVSLRTIDIIIAVVSVLLVGFLIYGVITGNPPA